MLLGHGESDKGVCHISMVLASTEQSSGGSRLLLTAYRLPLTALQPSDCFLPKVSPHSISSALRIPIRMASLTASSSSFPPSVIR